MTITYVTSKDPITPVRQTTYITTDPAALPTQTTYINVINTPRPQTNRWANKQKTHTATAGILLFAYGGMDMAQSLNWNLQTNIANTHELEFSWFIGVIIGALVASLSVTHVPKWCFYSLGGLMQMIDAIIFVSAPYNYTSIVAARYVGGAGIGLITVAFIIHNSEVATRSTRGLWCGLEQYGLALGIAIQVIIDSQWDTYSYVGVNCSHGIFGIVFSLIATGSVAMSVESPIFYLSKNDEEKARSCQWMLLPNSASTEACNEALDEAKRYVSASTSQSFGAELVGSITPFIKMIFSRCLVAFTFSLPLSYLMEISTFDSQGSLNWPIILWGILRWIGTIFTIALVDKLGRKFISLLGLLCMAALMLGMAGILSHSLNVYYMHQVCCISMAFQFFAGLYVACTPTYLGEAFPLRVKAILIGLIVCIEQVIHIIVIVTFAKKSDYFHYFLAVGIILAVAIIIFAVLMPETRGLTLRQTSERFRRVHDVMAY
ncbi:uncharacterized protein LOC135426454 [Drosophila montana]|uniref:uncharacterized protein LOC135426454 n=1 Tax=Drosophila montana TaxID=40370 RepID=UPI00313BE2F7